MWAQFTKEARLSILNAQEEALHWGAPYVGTEHLLLGVLRVEKCDAVCLLQKMDIQPGVLRQEVERRMERLGLDTVPDMQLTPRSKRVIDLAYEEMQRSHHLELGTEHLLLGLVRERAGTAGRALAEVGVDLEHARHIVCYGNLLRPSERPTDALLRPAQGVGDSDAERLPRPVESIDVELTEKRKRKSWWVRMRKQR